MPLINNYHFSGLTGLSNVSHRVKMSPNRSKKGAKRLD
jgi:hypothetical protein